MGDYCFRCVCLGSCLFIGCRGCAVPASERTVCAVGEKRRQTVFCVCECLKCQSKRFFQTDFQFAEIAGRIAERFELIPGFGGYIKRKNCICLYPGNTGDKCHLGSAEETWHKGVFPKQKGISI